MKLPAQPPLLLDLEKRIPRDLFLLFGLDTGKWLLAFVLVLTALSLELRNFTSKGQQDLSYLRAHPPPPLPALT